jgi:small subunit ribosomal protein S18
VFCTEHIPWVDYKDMNLLRRFMSDRGKIKSRANTGTCSQHQSDVALAIKNARELALLPYAVRTLAGDKSAGRRGRGAGRPGERPTGPPSGPPSAAGPGDGAAPVPPVAPVDGAAATTEPASPAVSEPVVAETAPAEVPTALPDAAAAVSDEVQS